MIWTIVCFLITLYVLKRFAFGPIQETIDERRERIRQSLSEADHAREEARKLLEEHRKLIAQARQQAEEIRDEVRRDGRRCASASATRSRPTASGACRRRRGRSRRRPRGRSRRSGARSPS